LQITYKQNADPVEQNRLRTNSLQSSERKPNRTKRASHCIETGFCSDAVSFWRGYTTPPVFSAPVHDDTVEFL